MTAHTITLSLDDEVVQRLRKDTVATTDKSDAEVVEDALTMYLFDRAVEAVRAAGPLSPDEADRLALEEVHAVRQARNNTA